MVEMTLMYAVHVPSVAHDWLQASACPPSTRLVGVELNPGPPKKAAQQPVKKKKQNRPAGMSAGNSGRNEIAAAYSSRLSTSVRFGSGSRAGSLRTGFCVPLCQIGNSGATGNNGLLRSDGNWVASQALSPVGLQYPLATTAAPGYWQSTAVNSISQAFSRYSTRQLRFKYCPQSTSTKDDQLVFGYSSDPLNPLLANGTTAMNLLGLSESVPFAPWNAWELPVRHDTVEKYLFNALTSTSDLDLRLNSAGSFGCVAENTAVVAPVVYGVLYLCGEFDFHDMNPYVLLTGSDPGRSISHRLAVSSSSPPAARHTCAAGASSSTSCIQCGCNADYVSVQEVKTSKSQ